MIKNVKVFLEHSFTTIVVNNIIALALHLTISIISIILLIVFVVTGPTLGVYTTHIMSRLFFIILHISLYLCAGMVLDSSKDEKYDFFAGTIIAVIGIGLWIYTLSKTGMNLVETPKELSEYWIIYNLYYSPFTMIYFLSGLNGSPLLSLLTNLLPPFLLGCGIKCRRITVKRSAVD
ncbi:hypothetical protein Amet_2107 [Alkaliphilus metalliredigens QYMF]|uniref:Uncharacterized protein n=1 Tax=Alkaliphilus metalliredigens (strain QYMF) TaxID=293826 RepID=A6TPZ9_ALKMQ|nr:hypothetical protein [Alkaliphilus metalliredigens]ABR48267.1 hypothetical protein Amet_2107 [Alkaliphilus metalliredigens QYMF]